MAVSCSPATPWYSHLKVRLDYFFGCGGVTYFGRKGQEVLADDDYDTSSYCYYSTRTNGIRRAVTPPAMEKGIGKGLN